ncbi:MAG: adenosylcobinamide-GDP ribazoletransferase [Thermoguttaceae bacterium]
MKRLLAAIRFLTIVPLPGTWGTAESDLAGSVPFFPVVGLLLGAAAAALAWALGHVAPQLVAAALLLVAMMSFSGCLHLDGLSDTADGFLSCRDRERILEIMRDSHAGAMGLITVVAVLLVKFAALASLAPASLWPAAGLMPLAGRAAICMHLALLPPAHPDGLGALFSRDRHVAAALGAMALLAVAATALLGPARGLTLAAACLAVTLLLAAYVYRKLGGATGDTLGAACEIVEVVPALGLALWPLDLVR